ncbi:MAG: hypothetical protein HY870_08120 [Chloroflexi bacterium]|nr:hypothetical protein [Chloroflexota bacterium]
MRLRRQTKHARGESKALADLGLVLLHLGEDQIALDYGRQAAHIAGRIGARPTYGYNLALLGDMWTALECWPEAATTYQHAVDVRRELGQQHLLLEPLAGLAQARLNQGEVVSAKQLIDEVWDGLVVHTTQLGRAGGWVGADDPERFYPTCQRVLNTLHDPRVELISKTAQILE